jgi:soluble lytic murein transglycosylase
VQTRSVTPARTTRQWLKVFLWTAAVLSASLSASLPSLSQETGGGSAQLPAALRLLGTKEDLHPSNPLKALKQGVDDFLKERYAAALEALRDDEVAVTANLGDYVLLYRGRAELMLDRNKEALGTFRLLESRYSASSLVEDALLGQCQALLKLEDPKPVLEILKDSRIQKDSETRYYEARALELAGEKQKAIERYLELYSGFPKAASAALAEKNLLRLSPGALQGKRNYRHRLLRAEGLLKANDARSARPLLLALGRVSAPDSESSQKRLLLLADVEYRLGRTTTALAHISKVTAANPSFHAKAIRLQGSCYRRLERETGLLSQRDRALKLYPLSLETEELCYLTATYFDIKYESAKAAQAYKILFEHFPKGRYAERSLWKLALFHYFEKEYGEAAQLFWRHLLAFPDVQAASSSMYWMGRCYEKLGGLTNARYLYGRVQALANNSYVGQYALKSEAAMGRSGATASTDIPGIDFEKVVAACDTIQIAPITIAAPSGGALPMIERARQLWAVGLPDLALFELRTAARLFPKDSQAIAYISSQVHADKNDYYKAIAGLRGLIPDYASRPIRMLPEEIWNLLYPVRHWNIIAARAAQADVDPALILGLIRQESSFNEQARSPANARGLMQILPSTGSRLALQAGIRGYRANKLFQAETNIILGTNYLSSLIKRYGKLELALAAYNAGGSRVDLWQKKFGEVDMPEFVEQIPFSETRGYVKQVLGNRAFYALLTSSASSEN